MDCYDNEINNSYRKFIISMLLIGIRVRRGLDWWYNE